MRLKRLELYGFKTFADATEFVFDDGITAIIGPNGSGKSNCADALLWVLAERRLSAIRASEPADVIFAGSSGRRPLSYAEVTLTVDNADGSLPLDMAEVSVGRRVYRNGETEYRLNNRVCRRRDVVDLFLDTGVGRPAFSVISQREIDALLSIDPADRRRMLDEVAGIERYRTQRDDTLRRLNDTAASLTRVDDLTAELRLQVEPLHEQRTTAQRFLELRARFEGLKLSLQVKDHALSGKRLERLREEMAGLDDAVTAAQAGLAELEAGEQGWRLELLALDEQLGTARGALHEAQLAAERHEADTRLRAEQEHNLSQRLAEADEAERRRADLLADEAERDSADAAEAERLLGELAALKTALEQRREASIAAKQAEDVVQGQASALRAELAQLDRQLATARAQRDSAAEALASATRRLEDLASRGQSAAERQATEQIKVEAAEAAVAAAEQAQAAANESRAQCAAQVTASEARLAELRKRAAAQQEVLGEARGRLSALVAAAQSYQGLFAGVKAVLQARDRGRLKTDFDPVADVLDVADGCDAALEAALGPRLQDLICAGGEDARAAIDLLKAERGGRATFLPMDLLERPGEPGDLSRLRRLPGVVGHALDLVTCDAYFETVRRHLLWNIVVVEDLEAGLGVRRAGFDRLVIATRDGDLIRPSGAITGGSREERGPTLLSRKRELERLEDEVQRREAEQTGLTAEQATSAAEHEAAQTAQREAGHAVYAAQKALSEAERARLQARAALARAESEAGRLGESETQLRADAERAQERMAQAEQAHATASTGREALVAGLAEHDAQYQAARVTRELADQALAAERVSTARVESRLQALGESAQRRAVARERAVREAERAVAERDSWQASIARLRGELEAAQTRHDDLLATVRAASAVVDGLRGQHQELAGRLETGTTELRAARGAQQAALEARHRAELREAQAVAELAHLEQALAEDHPGLTMAQAAERAEPIANRAEAAGELQALREAIGELGDVNVGAIEEYDRVTERIVFYEREKADLQRARDDLLLVMAEIDVVSRERLAQAFEAVNREFDTLFKRVFGTEGTGALAWCDPDNFLESGIEVMVQMPGKRTQNLTLLSGGERAMTTITLLMSMFRVKPTPFCLLDELDAPLDEANLRKYRELLDEFAQSSQFIVITHNPETTRAANTLYGITMAEPGVSRAYSHRVTAA